MNATEYRKINNKVMFMINALVVINILMLICLIILILK